MNKAELKNKKRITKATLKSFIRKNQNNLYVKAESSFDGMTDCVEFDRDAKIVKVKNTTHHTDHTLGIEGVWLVGDSRDYFTFIEEDGFFGIHGYNCCGSFSLFIKDEKEAETVNKETSYTIAKDLKNDYTNVVVKSYEELMNFVAFAGGLYDLYIWVGEWMTVGTVAESNDLKELFA